MFILPSRARPQAIGRLWYWYQKTRMSSKILVCVDEDDPCLVAYREQMEKIPAEHMQLRIAKRDHIGPLLNQVFAEYPQEHWYGLFGDDVIPPEYPGWDSILIEKAGSSKLAYPNDGIYGKAIATHPVIGGDAVRAAGFLAYGEMKHYFIDTWWSVIMYTLDRSVYFPCLALKHLHPSLGAKVDQTFIEGQSWFQHDAQIWDDFRNDFSLGWETLYRIEDQLQRGEKS